MTEFGYASDTEMIVRMAAKGQCIQHSDWINPSATDTSSEELTWAISACLFGQFSVGVGRIPFQPIAKCEWSELGECNASPPDETP